MSEVIEIHLIIDGEKTKRSISYNQYSLLKKVHGVDILLKHIDSMWEELNNSEKLIRKLER